LLDEQWENEPLFSQGELFAGFQTYHNLAVSAQTLLTDGSLDVWTFKYGEPAESRLYRRTHELSYSEYERERPTSDDYAGLEFQHDLDRSHDLRPLLGNVA
jgi:hypothetical protein